MSLGSNSAKWLLVGLAIVFAIIIQILIISKASDILIAVVGSAALLLTGIPPPVSLLTLRCSFLNL